MATQAPNLKASVKGSKYAAREPTRVRSPVSSHVYPLVNEHSNGKSPFFIGKSTISMAIFNCYVSSPEGTLWKMRRNLNTPIFPLGQRLSTCMLFIFGGSLLQSSSGLLIIPVVPFPSEKKKNHQNSQCCLRPFLGSYLGPCATPKHGNKFLCSIHVRYLPQIYDIWRLKPNMDKIIRKKTILYPHIYIYIYIYIYILYIRKLVPWSQHGRCITIFVD